MRLLLIEDDEILGQGPRDFLQAEGHAVDWANLLDNALRHGAQNVQLSAPAAGQLQLPPVPAGFAAVLELGPP